MRKLHVCAAIMGMVISLLPISLVNTSAAYSYDTNNDGVIDTLDVIYLNKYVSGLIDVPDVSKLDVDGNHVINAMDVQCLNYLFMGVSYSWEYVAF